MEQQNGNVLAFQIYTLLANWRPLLASGDKTIENYVLEEQNERIFRIM